MGIITKAGIVATLLACSVATNVYGQSNNQNVPKVVIQQYHKSTLDSQTEERQKLIDQVRQEFPSSYVGGVIYDSNHSQYIDYRVNQLHEELESENRWKAIFRGNYDIRKQHKNSLEDFLQRVSTDKEYKQSIRRIDIEAHYLMFLQERGNVIAATPFTDQFVRKDKEDIEKSQIFFFPLAFENSMKPQEYETVEVPLMTKLRVLYVHETQHARQNIDGFDLGDGETLEKYAFVDMTREVKMHVIEAEAHYKTYQYFKGDNDPFTEFLALDRLIRFYAGEIDSKYGVKIGGEEKYAELVAHYHKLGTYSDTEANAVAQLTKRFLQHKEEFYGTYHRLGKELSIPASQ